MCRRHRLGYCNGRRQVRLAIAVAQAARRASPRAALPPATLPLSALTVLQRRLRLRSGRLTRSAQVTEGGRDDGKIGEFGAGREVGVVKQRQHPLELGRGVRILPVERRLGIGIRVLHQRWQQRLTTLP